jgi:UrcA family protein
MLAAEARLCIEKSASSRQFAMSRSCPRDCSALILCPFTSTGQHFLFGGIRERHRRSKMIKSGPLAVVLAFASGAVAQPPATQTPVRTEQVTYADLDLTSTTGQATLQQRIRAAADRVCDMGGMQTMEDFSASSNCFRKAVADASRQMDQAVAAKRGGAVLAAAALIITAK